MYDPSFVYALDIETDNSPGRDGLDPANSSITEIAVACAPSVLGEGGVVFQGSEAFVLDSLEDLFQDLPPGLIVTWNGTFFDFPFISDRQGPSGMRSGSRMHLTPAPSLRPKYHGLPGHETEGNPGGGYQVSWLHAATRTAHAHLDVAQSYRRYANKQGVRWGLKPVCESLGIEMVELDRTRLHLYSPEERAAYNLSDSRGTRELALRLLGLDYPEEQA